MNEILDSSTNKKILTSNKRFDTQKINWHLTIVDVNFSKINA